MNAKMIEASLREHNFLIASVEHISYGQQLRLECGVIINVFDKGTVVAQGKLKPGYSAYLLDLLKDILPQAARWGL